MPEFEQEKMVKLVSELRRSVARLRSCPLRNSLKIPIKWEVASIILLWGLSRAWICVTT